MAAEVRWKYPLARRLLLFQSLSQALSWLACVALVLALVAAVNLLLGKDPVNLSCCIAAVVGSLPSLYAALPCVLDVDKGSPAQVMARLEPVARHLGYVMVEKPDAESGIFISRLPRVLRWHENRIIVRARSHGVCVEAPKLVARKISQHL